LTKPYQTTIDKLLLYLTRFEAGEKPDYDNWFMDFYKLAANEFTDIEYPQNIETMGWDRLTDIEFIGRADIDQLKTILTAICRSERFAMGGEPWGRYVDAGCFPAILRRLGELTYNV
jgi:hypothetical protein